MSIDECGAGASVAKGRPLVVAIDAGHGGSDPGVVWPPQPQTPAVHDVEAWRAYKLAMEEWSPVIVEKRVTMDLAIRLQRAIALSGLNAVGELTRDGDLDTSLSARGLLAEKHGADLTISLHVNSSSDPSIRGAIVFWRGGDDVGRRVAHEVAAAMPLSLRRRVNGGFPTVDHDWTRRARNCLDVYRCPAVLVEVAHATNEADRAELAKGEVREAIAGACLAGIREALALAA